MSGKVTCPQAVSRESHRTRNKNSKRVGLSLSDLLKSSKQKLSKYIVPIVHEFKNKQLLSV
jgi:hypothetical protein